MMEYPESNARKSRSVMSRHIIGDKASLDFDQLLQQQPDEKPSRNAFHRINNLSSINKSIDGQGKLLHSNIPI